MTNHPVHLYDREGNISPSSFIPFCAFGEDMHNMGREVEGFQDPVCDSFYPKVRNDQLCYEVDLKKFKNRTNMEEQLKSGLVLILDCNEERQSENYDPNRVKGKEDKFRNENKNEIHIHLDTISNIFLLIILHSNIIVQIQ